MKVYILTCLHIGVSKIIGVYENVGLALEAAERFRNTIGNDWRECTPEFLYEWNGPEERVLAISSHPVLAEKPLIIDPMKYLEKQPYVQDASDPNIQEAFKWTKNLNKN